MKQASPALFFWGALVLLAISPGRRRRGRGRTGTRSVRHFSCHERVATAITGDAQLERLKLFFNAQSHSTVGRLRIRFNLEPFAIFTLTPF